MHAVIYHPNHNQVGARTIRADLPHDLAEMQLCSALPTPNGSER
jgi:hypothetical protein